MSRFFSVLQTILKQVCDAFLDDDPEQNNMHSYAECRAVIESELQLYSKCFGLKVRQSKRSDNVWQIYVDGFYQAFIFYTRIVGRRGSVTSKCANNYRYTCKIDDHTTLLLTDKSKRDSAEVANLYLSDRKNPDNKRMQIRFIRTSQGE